METGDYDETVIWFLKNYKDVWLRWVTNEEALENLEAVLTLQ